MSKSTKKINIGEEIWKWAKKIINSFHKLHDYGFVKKLARCKKVQNLVIRDYATRTSKNLLLSSTEYKMNNSYLMLNSLIKNQNKKFNGIILYSLFMLKNYPKLDTFLNKLNKNKIKVFCALEEIELHNKYALQNLKKIFFINNKKKNERTRKKIS